MRAPLHLVLGSSPCLRRQSDFSSGKTKTLKEGFEVGDQISVLVSWDFCLLKIYLSLSVNVS